MSVDRARLPVEQVDAIHLCTGQAKMKEIQVAILEKTNIEVLQYEPMLKSRTF